MFLRFRQHNNSLHILMFLFSYYAYLHFVGFTYHVLYTIFGLGMYTNIQLHTHMCVNSYDTHMTFSYYMKRFYVKPL